MADAGAGSTYSVEPDFASRQAVLWSIVWLVVAVTFGLLVQVRLLFPDALGGFAALSYGRLAAVADTTFVFGWLTVAGFAAVFAILPRLAEAQLHNEVLGAAAVLFWSLTLFFGTGILLGGARATVGDGTWTDAVRDGFVASQGRPWAELPLALDVALLIVMALVAYDAGVTAIRRRERTLYASAWYLLAATILLPVVYAVGNIPVFPGVLDAIASGFYVNALEWYWFVPVALGTAFFLVPVETGNPLHSPRLARIAFWSLLFAGGWTGARFLLRGPAPDYVEATAVAMSAVLLVPVLSAASNLFATGGRRWSLAADAFGLRWAGTGIVLLVLWTALVALSAVPQVSALVGLTQWVTGLRHLALFGVFSAFAFALVYRGYPLMIGRAWASRSLSSFHYWATVLGVAAGSVTLMVQGVVQGVLTRASADADVSTLWQTLVGAQRGMQWAVALAFLLVAAGQYAFAWNAFRTARTGPIVQVMAPAVVPAGAAT